MKILLTGAKGQVGQEIVDLAKLLPCELFPFSKKELDITRPEQVEKAIQSCRPDLLINAAAYTAVDRAEQEVDQAFAINRDGVANLARLCQRSNLPLIHISTDYVFDGHKPTAYLEEDYYAPLNVYGKSKLAGEEALRQLWEKHVIVRTSWVFGKQGPNFVKTILKLALKQSVLRIVVDQKGCPTAASDLAASLLKIALQIHRGQPHWGCFHYCGDPETNWFEFAKRIIQVAKSRFELRVEKVEAIESAAFPTPAQRPKNSVLNMDKIKKDYALSPSAWEGALVALVQALAENGERSEYLST